MESIIPLIIVAAVAAGAAYYFLFYRKRNNVPEVPVATPPPGPVEVSTEAGNWTAEHSPGVTNPTQESQEAGR